VPGKVQFEGRPVWVEVSLGALAHNLRAIRKHINPDSSRRGAGARKILAVVKGNAYGHGAVPVAKALAQAGADWFGVTCTAEGMELRDAGIRQPILLLTGFWPGEEKRLLECRLTPAITRCEQLRHLERAAARWRSRGSARERCKPVSFHLKIDTGMNRLGISPSEVDCFARQLAECPHLQLTGTFMHFASSEVFTTEQSADQWKAFTNALDRLRALGVSPGVIHTANSAAVVARPDTWADMVRPGAVLYGYHQFFDPPERKAEAEAKLPLRPALSFRTQLISLREVPARQGVGYNARFVTQRASRVGVLAAGYADGVVRTLGNRGRVIIRGRFVPLVGTISMDLAMVDVTDLDEVRVGDVATIYGADGPATQYASDVARELGTITSDLLCAIGRRVPRFYLR
jgi:alanine racemase